MIDESTYLDLFEKLRYASDMIGVIVRDHHVINFRHVCTFRRGRDSTCIPIVKSWPPGVNQHGCARRRHDQSRLPALDVYEVDLQWLSLCRGGHEAKSTDDKESEERGALTTPVRANDEAIPGRDRGKLTRLREKIYRDCCRDAALLAQSDDGRH